MTNEIKGKVLKHLRENMGVSISEVSNETGLTESLINGIETGSNSARLKLLDYYSAYYGCSFEFLLSDRYGNAVSWYQGIALKAFLWYLSTGKSLKDYHERLVNENK